MTSIGGFHKVAAPARLRDKYWFLPALAALFGLGLGIALVVLDLEIGDAWLSRFEVLHGSRPEGARAMLSTIAGSTITVAGTVFSITLAAVTYASGQHGPRLLTNFARDRGNQMTLGVFIGTYVYCLIVLRTIRSAGEDGAAVAFVPHIAVYGALALALASIGMLIYFFHHVTETIHINRLIARIGRKLLDELAELDAETGDASTPATPAADSRSIATLCADRAGYIETIAHAVLADWVSDHGTTGRTEIVLYRRPGDFVRDGTPLLAILDATLLPGDQPAALRAAFTIGDRRTDLQDLRFGFDELTEIAIRALSPGINDPFTAVACLDWLTAALLACESVVAPADDDQNRVWRSVHIMPPNFADFLAASFTKLAQHAATEATVMAATLRGIDQLAVAAKHAANRQLLLAERIRLIQARS